ncbi:MAG TPA: hypothetical protein VFQ60_03530 [Patescibacteria group bacterium]|nr:hypothetical protein [Patescibacteria group bacterium]
MSVALNQTREFSLALLRVTEITEYTAAKIYGTYEWYQDVELVEDHVLGDYLFAADPVTNASEYDRLAELKPTLDQDLGLEP